MEQGKILDGLGYRASWEAIGLILALEFRQEILRSLLPLKVWTGVWLEIDENTSNKESIREVLVLQCMTMCQTRNLEFQLVAVGGRNHVKFSGNTLGKYLNVTLENLLPLDDYPSCYADRVVAPTPGFPITIPKTANEFAIKGENIIKIFYHGLSEITQEVLNAAARGIFLYKTPNQAYQLLEDKVIRVKQKQLNLGVGTKRMIFNIDFAMKHSYSNNDTCFSIDVINEILGEDFDALLDEGRKILHSIEGILLEEEIFAEFDEFMAMTDNEKLR
ncbi:hypothetical protein Tco_1172745 [Tanacetum coccineum]